MKSARLVSDVFRRDVRIKETTLSLLSEHTSHQMLDTISLQKKVKQSKQSNQTKQLLMQHNTILTRGKNQLKTRPLFRK